MKQYSTCQTVGELREAIINISDDVALFGDEEEERYVSVTVDLDEVAGNAVRMEPGPLVAEVMDRLSEESSAYCNGYEAAQQNIPESVAVADARQSYGEVLAEHFRSGYAEFLKKPNMPTLREALANLSDEEQQLLVQTAFHALTDVQFSKAVAGLLGVPVEKLVGEGAFDEVVLDPLWNLATAHWYSEQPKI